MKKYFLLFCTIVLCSNSVRESSLLSPHSPFIEVYRGTWTPNGLPTHLIIRKRPNVLEIHSPLLFDSVFGPWEIKNDTLFFTPEYGMVARKDRLGVYDAKIGSSFVTIPHQYLIKKDCLIDITDYVSWSERQWPDWPDRPVPSGDTYKRVDQVFCSSEE